MLQPPDLGFVLQPLYAACSIAPFELALMHHGIRQHDGAAHLQCHDWEEGKQYGFYMLESSSACVMFPNVLHSSGPRSNLVIYLLESEVYLSHCLHVGPEV